MTQLRTPSFGDPPFLIEVELRAVDEACFRQVRLSMVGACDDIAQTISGDHVSPRSGSCGSTRSWLNLPGLDAVRHQVRAAIRWSLHYRTVAPSCSTATAGRGEARGLRGAHER